MWIIYRREGILEGMLYWDGLCEGILEGILVGVEVGGHIPGPFSM